MVVVLKGDPLLWVESLGILAQLELHGVVTRSIGTDKAQGGIDLYLIAFLHLQRGEVEVGRDVLPMTYHDDIGALYLRMLEDE